LTPVLGKPTKTPPTPVDEEQHNEIKKPSIDVRAEPFKRPKLLDNNQISDIAYRIAQESSKHTRQPPEPTEPPSKRSLSSFRIIKAGKRVIINERYTGAKSKHLLVQEGSRKSSAEGEKASRKRKHISEV
jgi:hypothetical protein